MTSPAPLDWTEHRRAAVDTARVLAMDAVAEGRQRPPRHRDEPRPGGVPALPEGDAAQPRRPGLGRPRPLRALLPATARSPSTSSSSSAAGASSSRTSRRCAPGAARPPATPSTATPPASRPPPARSARASPTPWAWRWRPAASAACSTPTPADGDSLFDHHVYAICSDGDIEEGVSAEASALAGVQSLGNLTVIYDANQISIEDDTDIALSEDVAARYEAYGWHVQTVDWTNGGNEYVEDVPALHDAIAAAETVTDRPSFIVLQARSSPGPPPTPRTPAPRTARRWAPTRWPRPRSSSASTPSRPSSLEAGVLEHTRGAVERGKAAQARVGRRTSAPGPRPTPSGAAIFERMRTRTLPEGWDADLPSFEADAKGVATRKASGAVINAIASTRARAVGWLGRPRRLQQHHHRGRPLVHPRRALHRLLEGRPVRRPRAALRHPRARAWARS